MAHYDRDDIRIRPGRSRRAKTRGNPHDLPFTRQVELAVRRAGGGSSTATSYIWCGTRICQARNASNATTREYFAEGEFIPGVSAQSYYYGPDQIGSVRRVFASTSSAPAYSYDPWGNALQSTAPLTDFNYAGMLYNADSGLYLTQYRAYDPVAGRWLARDPFDESSDPAANLYRYANGNPLSLRDPNGRFGIPGAVIGGAVGGLAGGLGNLALQLYRNGGNFGCINRGQVAASALLGAGIGALLGGTFGLAGPAAPALGDAGGIGGVDVGIEISAAEGATSAEEVIAPGGKLIGTPNPGSPGDVQNLPGGDQAAQDLFNQLSEFGTPGSKPGYPGPTVDLPNGGFAGYRSAASSSSGVPAVDVNIPDTYVGKFHFS